jgi:hypothetical protein
MIDNLTICITKHVFYKQLKEWCLELVIVQWVAQTSIDFHDIEMV